MNNSIARICANSADIEQAAIHSSLRLGGQDDFYFRPLKYWGYVGIDGDICRPSLAMQATRRAADSLVMPKAPTTRSDGNRHVHAGDEAEEIAESLEAVHQDRINLVKSAAAFTGKFGAIKILCYQFGHVFVKRQSIRLGAAPCPDLFALLFRQYQIRYCSLTYEFCKNNNEASHAETVSS